MFTRPVLCRPAARQVAVGERLRLVDGVELQLSLLEKVLVERGAKLPDVTVPPGPGFYALHYRGTHPLYCDLDRRVPIYIGKSAHLPGRLSSHRCSLNAVPDLNPDDFDALVVPTAELHDAELAERLLFGAFDPLWNRDGWRGFGSRPQGCGRTGQAPTEWDRRHPGRSSRIQAA